MEDSAVLATEVERKQNLFSKNGPIDLQEVQFGGQAGYRMIYTSNYSAPKGSKELSYMTVRAGTLYELNYFPVAQHVGLADEVAASFEFTP